MRTLGYVAVGVLLFAWSSPLNESMKVAVKRSLSPVDFGNEDPVEEVRIFRSVPTSRMVGSKAAAKCPQAPFVVVSYDEFDLVTVQTRSRDGIVTDPAVEKIGTLIGCLGAPNTAGHLPFYSQGHFNDRGQEKGLSFVGNGECDGVSGPVPPQVSVFRCWVTASKLPAGYTGGFITSNTLATVLPGYLNRSIGVARFWKQP